LPAGGIAAQGTRCPRQARAAYFRLAKDYTLLELNRSDEASLTQTLEMGRAKLEVGNQAQADVLTTEGDLVRIAEARRIWSAPFPRTATRLNVLMNRQPSAPLGRPAALSTHPAMPRLERLQSLLFSHRPEVRMAEAGVTGAKAKLELAKREWIPDPAVSVETQRYNGGSQVASEVSAGISFNVPWFNGKKYRAGESEAQKAMEAAQWALESARTEALGLLRDQFQKIETSYRHVEAFEARLIPNARQTLQTNRTNYEGGKTSFLEMVMADRSLREVESLFQQHLADCQIAIAEVEALVGADIDATPSHHETYSGGPNERAKIPALSGRHRGNGQPRGVADRVPKTGRCGH
jgi:outer membrane protein TolC